MTTRESRPEANRAATSRFAGDKTRVAPVPDISCVLALTVTRDDDRWWYPVTEAPPGATVDVTIPPGALALDLDRMLQSAPAGVRWVLRSSSARTLRLWRAVLLDLEGVA